MNRMWQAITSSDHYPAQLPVNDVLGDICDSLAVHHTLVLKAPPGAGKTTLVPLALMTQPWVYPDESAQTPPQKILMLEPRRLAAKASAMRMASILGEKVGERIGYRMRNESKTSSHTLVEVITEGLLTRLLQDDPALTGISAIIFDEFHERNLNSDLGLALALQSAEYFHDENPLRLIIMSATLEGINFSKVLPNVPVLESLGRQFPVELSYSKTLPVNENLASPMAQLIYKAVTETAGSILAFLPGQKEIRQLQTLLENSDVIKKASVQVFSLYGSLSIEQQWAAIEPLKEGSGYQRKLVLATDIAETSLTIEGISTVVDSGLCRVSVFDPQTAMTSLQTKRISQASSIQRAGRAGRTSAGHCYRLWGESTQASLAKQSTPELLQADLSDLALQLFCWGVSHTDELNWLDEPPLGLFAQATDLLMTFTAVTSDIQGQRSITAYGRLMSELPTHPRLANMLLLAAVLEQKDATFKWLERACAISCLMSERDPLHYLNADLDKRVDILLGDSHVEKKFLPWLKRNQFQMKQLQKKLSTLTTPVNESQFDALSIDFDACFELAEHEVTAFLLSLAFPDRVGLSCQQNNRYKLSNGQRVSFYYDDDMTAHNFIVVAQSGGSRVNNSSPGASIFSAAVLSQESFERIYQYQINDVVSMYWDDRKARFIAEQQRCFKQLCLSTKATNTVPVDEKRRALLALLKNKGLRLLHWSEEAIQLQARVQLAHRLQCENKLSNSYHTWPVFDEPYLQSIANDWLAHHLDSIKVLSDFKQINVEKALQTLLPWPMLQQLDDLLPERYTVPSGSNKKLDYSQQTPILAVKLQEMFGAQQTPSVANGAVPLLVHLLSPAGKTLQVTQDLASFWQGSYEAVKKDMKGKYPRHPWPDDPLNFEATALTKSRLANKKT